MITPEYVRQMALYGRWQNEKLFALLDALSDEERKRERAMFFGSMHRTLGHIANVDRAILHLLRTGERVEQPLERPIPEDFAALRHERVQIDEELAALAEQREQPWFEDKASTRFRMTRGFLLTQLFNHQTHHRSQVTSELHRLGIDYGCTDMPYNPYLLPG